MSLLGARNAKLMLICSGLNTVNLSELNTFQQVMMFLLIMIGSAIFVSAFVVHVRKRAFERRFAYIAAQRRRRSERGTSLTRCFSRSRSRPATRDLQPDTAPPPEASIEPPKEQTHGKAAAEPHPSMEKPSPQQPSITGTSQTEDEIRACPNQVANEHPSHITFDSSIFFHMAKTAPGHHHPHFVPEPRPIGKNRPRTSESHGGLPQAQLESFESAQNHLPFSTHGFLSRNSNFHHLSEGERQTLGGYEYRAVCLLSWLVPAYYILFQLLGCIGLGAYIANNRPSTTLTNGLHPWWVGIFFGASAFNNSGMSLLDANMVAFQTSIYMCITMGLLILAGNTCYPIFLRLIIWTMAKMLPVNERWDDNRKTLKFLLDHPRRCYTNLFPSHHTWWLAASVILLNGIDWAGFEILNIGNKAINALPQNIRVLDGLFQALAVRSGGFYVVPISTVRVSLQVLYAIMMYISVYPVVITMRNSNVYEERSLGIYADEERYTGKSSRHMFTTRTRQSRLLGSLRNTYNSYFVRQQLRAQLSHDLWLVVLAVFVIMIIEGSNFERDPVTFSVFNVIFETISAYGCVGVSLGVPDNSHSFSGSFHKLSKLVLCFVMIRGRHRGLPVAIDKAILLPGDGVDGAEEEDGEIRLERSISRGRVV